MMNRGKRFFGPILTGASTGAVMCVALVALQGCLPTSNTRWEEDRSIPFSPDDRAIAYQHKGSIYVARTQGDEHRRIFESTADAIVSTPHWAPGQRAVLFAVSNGEQDAEPGLLDYELWFWPAPESIWASAADDAEGDTVELPVDWEPLAPRKLLTAQCRHAVQIKADALFAWHPDGNQRHSTPGAWRSPSVLRAIDCTWPLRMQKRPSCGLVLWVPPEKPGGKLKLIPGLAISRRWRWTTNLKRATRQCCMTSDRGSVCGHLIPSGLPTHA
jgi:hypothetical protein